MASVAFLPARLARRALDLIYPPRAVCAACGRKSGCPEDHLCAECRALLDADAPRLEMNPFHSRLSGRVSAHGYRGPAGVIVQRMKYDRLRALAPIMARDMIAALRTPGPDGAPRLPLSFDCVLSVPMHPLRRYLRGMNHAELLAREVARELDLPWLDALRRVRNTKQQARLSGEARRQNLIGAFRAERTVSGRSVLLVDDVLTTGSTAENCAEALLKAGATRVFLLTYAQA